jgi:hypothetical protein
MPTGHLGTYSLYQSQRTRDLGGGNIINSEVNPRQFV